MDIGDLDLYLLPWRNISKPHLHHIFPPSAVAEVTSLSPLILMLIELSLSIFLGFYHSLSNSPPEADFELINGCGWIDRENILNI